MTWIGRNVRVTNHMATGESTNGGEGKIKRRKRQGLRARKNHEIDSVEGGTRPK